MKKFFALVLALVMALSLTTAAWGATEKPCASNPCAHGAAIDTAHYDTLADAVADVATGGTATITLLKSHSGAGIFLDDDDNKTITIDFATYTYTCTGPAVGSAGTATQAFHLEENNTVKMMNGTVTSNCADVKMLVQNYCDLTLENMVLDGTQLPGSGRYTLSNNQGNVVIDDTTITAAAADGIAFDVCDYADYTGVSVTVKGDSVINGKIELSDDDTADNNVTKLVIESGEINGEIDVATSDMTEDVTISGGSFSVMPDESYLADDVTFVGNTVEALVKNSSSVQGLWAKGTNDPVTADPYPVNIVVTPAKDVKYNKTTGAFEDFGEVKHVNITGDATDYVFVNTLAEADLVLFKDAAGKSVKYYLAAVETPEYVEGVVFNNFGDKCGQVDYDEDAGYDKKLKYFTIKGFEEFILVEEAEEYACDAYVMYGGKMIPVVVLDLQKVEHVAVTEYDKNMNIEKIYCSACDTVALKAANMMSVPKGAVIAAQDGAAYWYWPVAVSTTSTDKTVTSAQTFDAGIAMYVGMSVMAAAGSAVVLKKKD